MNRFRARLSSAVCAALILVSAATPLAVRAQTPARTTFWFAGTRLIFDSPVALSGDVAVSIHDSGLQRLLARVGASLAYVPQQRYVIVTSADRRVISLSVGDARYTVAGVTSTAAFAPFFDGNDVIVPLYEIVRALYVEPVVSATETVLEPQIGALDVRPDGRRTIVTLRGATPLKYTTASESSERLAVTFSGIGSTLAQRRRVGGGVDDVDIAVAGNPKNPNATVTISAPAGSAHVISTASSPYEFTVIFGPPGVALDAGPVPAASAAPVAEFTPAPQASAPQVQPSAPATPQTGPATITRIDVTKTADGGVAVALAIDGTATFSWHRLRDERWYLDIAGAALTGAGRDERPDTASVDSVRVRQIGTPGAPVVRVAFTLHGEPRIDVRPADGTLAIAVGTESDANLARTGNGQIGGATVAQSSAQSPAGPPIAPIAPAPEATPWKFGPANPAAGRNRIIVLDPGHGGADAGTAHNGLVEKRLTLDIALRLRSLLTAAGWIVRMTRETDIDPVSPATLAAFAGDGKPNSSDRAYLQTRCDVANAAGARMFISIHINYADAASVRGTTFYYTKPQDVPLAQALERGVIPAAGTQDDGVVKSNLYVTKHTAMPAVLIETGFISNPGDVQLLADPAFLQNVAAGIAAGVKAYAGAVPAAPDPDQ